jgi:hypothetical protein
MGVIPNHADLASVNVDCAITAAEPDFDLNIIGGDNITFSGEHFPWSLQENGNTITVVFDDADSTACIA